MMNPYKPNNSTNDFDRTKIMDTKTTVAFWASLVCGAASWIAAAQIYQFGLRTIYIDPPAMFAYILAPATLMLGLASFLLLAYGYRRQSRLPNHRLAGLRFLIAGVPSCIPGTLLFLLLLDWRF